MGEKRYKKSTKVLYARQVLSSFGDGVGGTYIPIYAVQLGASPVDVGWLRSLGNLFGNVMQVPWGMVCDRFKAHALFIILGSLIVSLLWIPMLHVRGSWELILLFAAQAFATSMVTPAWSALLGDMAPKVERGELMAKMTIVASLGSMMATAVSGYSMTSMRGGDINLYTIPFALAAGCGVMSSFVMLSFWRRGDGREGKPPTSSWFGLHAFRGDFRWFFWLVSFHSFFMSISWPLFPITTVMIVGDDMMMIAYRSIISGAIALLARRFFGRLSDRAGRKSIMVIGRAGIFLYPLIYAFATNIYHLYLAEIVVGILIAGSDIAIFAYVLDITPEGQRGSSFALYNTTTGVSTFFGSLLGGYLATIFGSYGLDGATALRLTYGISTAGRLVLGLLFLWIKEPYRYPSTIKEGISQIVSEDSGRVKARIESVEERAMAAEEDLRADLEWFEALRWRKDRK